MDLCERCLTKLIDPPTLRTFKDIDRLVTTPKRVYTRTKFRKTLEKSLEPPKTA